MWRISGRAAAVPGPVLCFAGHTDVVPTGPLEEWRTKPFEPTGARGCAVRARRGGHEKWTGRHGDRRRSVRDGASPPPRNHVPFLITSDEDGPSVDGTKRVVGNAAGARGSALTGASWRTLQRSRPGRHHQDRTPGVAVGRLTVHGVQGHIAYPHLAVNPFTPWHGVGRADQPPMGPGNEHFQPTTFQVSNLNAGTGAPNVIPGDLKARSICAIPPVQTLDQLNQMSRASCASTRSTSAWSGMCPVNLLYPAGPAVGCGVQGDRRGGRRAAQAVHGGRHL